MTGDLIPANVLATHTIANVSETLAEKLGLPQQYRSIVYFAHTVSRTGTYLSKTAGVREGEALAYLIAPPLEAVVGLDDLFEPPSETNFGGGLLTGTQSACNAACAAFAEAVKAVAARPREI